MTKFLVVIALIAALFAALYLKLASPSGPSPDPNPAPTVTQANPASEYCQTNGGVLEIITHSDGSQIGLCRLDDYACEEWAYYRGECAVEEDAEQIKQALIAKGLDLTDMKVVIYTHLGQYLAGGVVPVSAPAGGGYVFAQKDVSGNISIVADGNGAITCSMLVNYPDFPAYLIPECLDDEGNQTPR
jgi:uncharacterized protein